MTIFSYQTNIHRLVTSHCRMIPCYSMVCRLLDFLIKKSPQVATRLIRTDHRLRLNTVNESLLSFTLGPCKNPVCYSGLLAPSAYLHTHKQKRDPLISLNMIIMPKIDMPAVNNVLLSVFNSYLSWFAKLKRITQSYSAYG